VRKAIGVVPQDTPLFNNTIEHNIHYGNLEASKEMIVEAAKKAHIHDTIQGFPDGYQTMVGERGMMISGMMYKADFGGALLTRCIGGEKQRLAVSRLILKDPPLLFFDEAVCYISLISSCLHANPRADIGTRHPHRTSSSPAHKRHSEGEEAYLSFCRASFKNYLRL
jgi:ABC transporter ATM